MSDKKMAFMLCLFALGAVMTMIAIVEHITDSEPVKVQLVRPDT